MLLTLIVLMLMLTLMLLVFRLRNIKIVLKFGDELL